MSDIYVEMAEEADRYADLLAEMQGIDSDLLRYGLRHEYDVIVSEALDYVINLAKTDEFKEEIGGIAEKKESSYLVSGRLIMCEALCNDLELKQKIQKINYDNTDEYFQVWENSAAYIKSGDPEALHRVEALTTAPDRTVASLSKSLLGFLKRGKWDKRE